LALIVPRAGEAYLIDATPDLRDQLAMIQDSARAPRGAVDRDPLDGVLLTHAHIGHYSGLVFFGFEAIHTRELPVFCTPRMAAFLRSNGPWSQLVALGNIVLREVHDGAPFVLGREVEVTPVAVAHRDELSDTVGFLLRGPRARVLYVPDTDGWEAWPRPVREVLSGVDVAILDGTFYSAGEVPGRDPSSIPHPLIPATMDLLEPLVREGRLRVYLTHLNHTNPALDPDSSERARIESRGFRVLEEGQQFEL
jgi:pyrroloquinoline quinone biosynthesis protein B